MSYSSVCCDDMQWETNETANSSFSQLKSSSRPMYITHTQNTLCIAKCLSFSVARWNCVPFASVVVCSQAAAFTVLDFFSPRPERVASGMSSLNFIIWLNKLPALCFGVLFYFFFHKLYIWLFTSRELKAKKHFQIELHGCNQNSGDSWRVWTCPVREQWDPRWCPHGQTHDSLKVHVTIQK